MILLTRVCLFGNLSASGSAVGRVGQIVVEVADHFFLADSRSGGVLLAGCLLRLCLHEGVVADGFVVVYFGVVAGNFLDCALETAVGRPLPLFGFELVDAGGFGLTLDDLLLQLHLLLS